MARAGLRGDLRVCQRVGASAEQQADARQRRQLLSGTGPGTAWMSPAEAAAARALTDGAAALWSQPRRSCPRPALTSPSLPANSACQRWRWQSSGTTSSSSKCRRRGGQVSGGTGRLRYEAYEAGDACDATEHATERCEGFSERRRTADFPPVLASGLDKSVVSRVRPPMIQRPNHLALSCVDECDPVRGRVGVAGSPTIRRDNVSTAGREETR